MVSNSMNITLPADLESYIEQSVRSGAFDSASEFVAAAARRQMQEEAWFEQKVLEGLEGPVTPLTREDLDSVRDIVKARARPSA
jgi:putative addiction module CopG family antidote